MKIISWGMLCLAFVCFHTAPLHAQNNLVPNGSFEQLIDCEIGQFSIYKAPPWYSPLNEFNDTYLRGALCNRCAPSLTSGNVPFPAGGADYQEPVSGDGFSGIVLNQAVPSVLLRNYIGTTLLDTLEAGRIYFISWYVNNEDIQTYGSNNMSMLLTDTPVTRSYEGGGYILANAQITAYSNPIIADTQHWVQIAAIYQAQGWESSIMIGDFTDGSNQDTIRIRGDDDFGISGYFIDDVSITPLDSLPRIFIGGPDTSVIIGNSVKIGTLINGLPGMLWYNEFGALISTGPPQASVSPTFNTWYRAEVTVGGITYRDTVNVAVIMGNGVEDVSGIGDLHVYPNPTSGPLEILLPPDFRNWRIIITDAKGAAMPAWPAPQSQKITLRLEAAPGLYFLQIRNMETGRSMVSHILLQP